MTGNLVESRLLSLRTGLLPLLLPMLAVLLLLRDTAVAMVTIWHRSETYAHAFLVPPIVIWLVWRRRHELAALKPSPSWWVLLPMAGASLLWLLGDLASVNAVTQFALVALLVLCVPLVLGVHVARALAFPLLFSFFAVPVGDFMVAPMMEWTADFTVAALRLFGVPVLREGLQFIIPTGAWSVVEACSGVRYLIASFMVGSLFAYLNYRSNARRVVFIVVSLLVPVVANWLRALIIVLLGHLSGNKIAAGADHLIYGWVFFGIVIGIMFWIGSFWSEPDAPAGAVPATAPAAGSGVRTEGKVWLAAGLACLVLAGMVGLQRFSTRDLAGPAPVFDLPPALAGAWKADPEPLTLWEPRYANPSARAQAIYDAGAGRVGLGVWYYRNQRPDRKLVTSVNTLADMGEEQSWSLLGSGGLVARAGDRAQAVRTAVVRRNTSLGDDTAQRLRVWQVYWVDGHFETSDARAKLRLALARLQGRGDDAAGIFIYTELGAEGVKAADELLSGFLADNGPAIESLLTTTRDRR